MPRGQAAFVKCPHCKRTRIFSTGKTRERTYVHGNRTGLPDSTLQYEVVCLKCGYDWWSRHPDAKRAFKWIEKEIDFKARAKKIE